MRIKKRYNRRLKKYGEFLLQDKEKRCNFKKKNELGGFKARFTTIARSFNALRNRERNIVGSKKGKRLNT